jgi:hypothetical protein
MDNIAIVAEQVGVLFALMSVGAGCRLTKLLDDGAVGDCEHPHACGDAMSRRRLFQPAVRPGAAQVAGCGVYPRLRRPRVPSPVPQAKRFPVPQN